MPVSPETKQNALLLGVKWVLAHEEMTMSALLLLLYCLSLVLVIWAVVDVARRPAIELPSQKKALWIIGSLAGWLLFGIVGAVVAGCYLFGPRRRLNASRW